MKRILIAGLFFLLLVCSVQAKKPITELNLVFIGNSITQGVGLQQPSVQAPPARTATYLNNHQYTVKFINCGVSGSTSVDFLPATNKLFPNVIQAADSLAKNGKPLVFSVMIGTNDSAIKGPNGSPVSPDTYHRNLLLIIDTLLRRYPQSHIVLHRPIWYSPNTHNGALYMAEGLARLQSYTPELLSIAQERKGKVLIGDRKAFDFFRQNHLVYLVPENGNSGIFYLHPNALGAEKLGEFWARALITQINKIEN